MSVCDLHVLKIDGNRTTPNCNMQTCTCTCMLLIYKNIRRGICIHQCTCHHPKTYKDGDMHVIIVECYCP